MKKKNVALLLLPAFVQLGCGGAAETHPENTGEEEQAVTCGGARPPNATQTLNGGTHGAINTSSGVDPNADWVLEVDSVTSKSSMTASVHYNGGLPPSPGTCNDEFVDGLLFAWSDSQSCWYLYGGFKGARGTGTWPNCTPAVVSWPVTQPQPTKLKIEGFSEGFWNGVWNVVGSTDELQWSNPPA